MMFNSSSHPYPNHFCSHSVVEKLDDSNYLLWKKHVEHIITSHQLHRFVVNPVIPPQFLSVSMVYSIPLMMNEKFRINSYLHGFSLLYPSLGPDSWTIFQLNGSLRWVVAHWSSCANFWKQNHEEILRSY